ncbi:hypothetical protein C0Q70_10143 [Pomacea canaliculata]|uniref:Uncharacterized protein n=2 Tax=Pomacea canaliculata TaxID=400727 RepID=A0A2T7PBS9_POMCA|nr:hypothetical protein C0Q70_10143 [Pomacea canaliculata]
MVTTVRAFGADQPQPVPDFGSRYYDRKFQSWLMNKRGLGDADYEGFGRSFGDEDRFFNWRDYFANGVSKRQFSYTPGRFGSFRRLFTNGLQDWRNTFTNVKKRSVSDDHNTAA